MNVVSLFAGIGGLDLGLERAGMTVVGQVEIDPWCRNILAKHWPEVPRHDDVRTVVDWWQSEPRPGVDVVAGGPPCQPVSQRGLRKAQKDPRWLWPHMAAVTAALAPRWVIVENVPGLHRLGLGDVLSDLDRIGYRTRPGTISACEMGAPHARKRVLVLAHAASERCGIGTRQLSGLGPAQRGCWVTEPDVGRVAYGVPRRVDRLRGLGNAVVPQVAEHIGRLIMTADTPGG